MTDEQLLDQILANEAGYQNDEADSGNFNSRGERVGTNYGITPATYEFFYHRVPTEEDMHHLTTGEAKEIYRLLYVAPFDGTGALKPELVDFAVNCGVLVAVKSLQKALGVTVDGILGPATRDAILKVKDWPGLERKVTILRIERSVDAILARPAKRKYLEGWLRRTLAMEGA